MKPTANKPNSQIQLSYSIPDAARAIGVGRSTIYQLLKDGRLQSVHIGKRRLIRADSLKALVQGNPA